MNAEKKIETRTTRTWERHEKIKNMRAKYERKDESGSYTYNTTYRAAEELVTYTGEFEIQIDVEAIAHMLSGRAANSKTGKSAFLGGMLKAKRLSMREVARVKKEYPLPANYQVIE